MILIGHKFGSPADNLNGTRAKVIQKTYSVNELIEYFQKFNFFPVEFHIPDCCWLEILEEIPN